MEVAGHLESCHRAAEVQKLETREDDEADTAHGGSGLK
jgi:hypothetical protein